MNRFALLCLGSGLLLVSRVSFGDVGAEFHGTFEGGVGISMPGPPASKVFVDEAALNFTGTASDKVKIVINNSLSMASLAGHPDFDSRNYWGPNVIKGGGLTLANTAAYVNFKWSEYSDLYVGYWDAPFGSEIMARRYDMHSYFYSTTMALVSNQLGWIHDLGIWGKYTHLVPGTIEMAMLDGRQLQGEDIPATAARWHMDIDIGDMTITPILSAYLGGVPPGPDPIDEGGFTAGLQWKMNDVWANAEFLTGTQRVLGLTYVTSSLVLEPGFYYDKFGVSAKLDLTTLNGVSDQNLGFVVSRAFDDDKLRVRFACMLGNLSGRLGVHLSDFRVLFGTAL
jgi:hypothetical protein